MHNRIKEINNMENDLMQKLVKSKAIMDVHNKIPRSGNSMPMGDNVDFSIPNARYNIPDDILSENEMLAPVMPIKNIETPSEDAIKKSRLPDEIKRIMLEHPIAQVQQPIGRNILTDEMVEKASKLMGNKPKQNIVEQKQVSNTQIDAEYIKKIVKETVKSTIKEMGLLTESTEKSDEFFQFRVGSHIFEGKIQKIKKIKS
jgi:hypothetical protein